MMKENSFEKNSILKIENIKGPNNGEVSICPKRGGIITGMELSGKQIIFMEEETFVNITVNVKGGIPVLFPNAGPVTDQKLKQHGFARNFEFDFEKTENGFKETLLSNEEIRQMYPYDFRFSVLGKFEEDGSFTLEQEVENKEENKELPLSDGFHPYFNLPGEEDSYIKKSQIKFDFEGGNLVEEQLEKWVNGEYISIDNPKLKYPNAVIKIIIPNTGTLTINPSVEYKKIWIWSMPGKDFICVEPVMRDKNGLIDDPEIIAPKQTFKASVNFKLEE